MVPFYALEGKPVNPNAQLYKNKSRLPLNCLTHNLLQNSTSASDELLLLILQKFSVSLYKVMQQSRNFASFIFSLKAPAFEPLLKLSAVVKGVFNGM